MNGKVADPRHNDLINRIPDLLAGNLGWWERRALNRHLRTCSTCQAEVATYRQIDEGLRKAVPELFDENQPRIEFMKRIEETIDHHPVSRQPVALHRIAKLALPAVAVLAVVAGIALVMTLSGGGASALSLATPVKGTMLVTEAGELVAQGDFAYVSPALWKRTTAYPRAPQAVSVLSEVSVGGETFVRLGDGPWRRGDETPAVRQPIPGLGDLGQTERLFDAVLNLYRLDKGSQREFRGERVSEFTGVDAGYAARLRDAELESGASEQQVAPLFAFYRENPPKVTVLADDDEQIQAILIEVPLPQRWFVDVPRPQRSNAMFVEIVIEESNASVAIVPPVP